MKPVPMLCSLVLFSCLLPAQGAFAQAAPGSYAATISAHIKKYVETHEVVKGDDRRHLRFFAPDSTYRVTATFERSSDAVGFGMMTSGRSVQEYFRYGTLRFAVNGAEQRLTIYQSKQLMHNEAYKNYLFIPFTDATTGKESYDGGRYLDLSIPDIREGKVLLDFNKAYNPYCCYVAGYQCPIPPKENALPVAIRAGEMNYGKPGH
ncbi:DUF1684 domain-containing protein [Flaviaesturariibacter amylovorans]|uniref:DUF1684 domain-containing protein n=1 Tax=Flaviaesturariibacter amylovorans TaxID=1084520 RepID=A0ABP8G7T3_9BACT